MVGLEGDFVRGMFRVCLGIVCVGLDVGLGVGFDVGLGGGLGGT